MEKVRAELAIFYDWDSLRVTSNVIFIVCTIIDNSYETTTAQEFEQLL